jgi:hypothetical protein
MELTFTQTSIMLFIKDWANTQKTTVPKIKIVQNLVKRNMRPSTIMLALQSLINKGYLRRSTYPQKRNQTEYVMIRNI